MEKARHQLLAAYGGKCACCGESNPEFLAVDHIEGNGAKHRRKLTEEGLNFHTWIRRENYPKGFRLLCHNCNFAKGKYGFCPHTGKPATPVFFSKRDGKFVPDLAPPYAGRKSRVAKVSTSDPQLAKRVAVAARVRKWRASHPKNRTRERQHTRDYKRRTREAAIKHYGGACTCCSESLAELLVVTPKGNSEKAPRGVPISLWLKKQGYPTGYVVFCRGCLFSREKLGYCAHQDSVI